MLPKLRTAIPGPHSRALARQLRRYESRNITFISNHWPVFWERATGANVWDVDGNRYLDLTAAFGVASVGHGNPRVVAALRQQAGQLIHAMGDVHPNQLKLKLARELVALTFRRNARVITVKSRNTYQITWVHLSFEKTASRELNAAQQYVYMEKLPQKRLELRSRDDPAGSAGFSHGSAF